MLKGFTRDGKLIIGTYDLIPATAMIRGRGTDGELIYAEESAVVWEAAETQRENGQRIFVDETYRHILENEIDWRVI